MIPVISQRLIAFYSVYIHDGWSVLCDVYVNAEADLRLAGGGGGRSGVKF